MDQFLLVVGAVALAIITAIAVGILAPLGYAAGGYLTGWVLATVFPFAGQWIIDGLGCLGTEVSLNALPIIGAALGFVGSFFKATQTNKNENK
jgi:hypothetical protein